MWKDNFRHKFRGSWNIESCIRPCCSLRRKEKIVETNCPSHFRLEKNKKKTKDYAVGINVALARRYYWSFQLQISMMCCNVCILLCPIKLCHKVH